jgi:hypothetical protein
MSHQSTALPPSPESVTHLRAREDANAAFPPSYCLKSAREADGFPFEAQCLSAVRLREPYPQPQQRGGNIRWLIQLLYALSMLTFTLRDNARRALHTAGLYGSGSIFFSFLF